MEKEILHGRRDHHIRHLFAYFCSSFAFDKTPAHYFWLTREIFRGERPDRGSLVIPLHMQQTLSTLWNRWSLSNTTLWCQMMSGLWLAMSFQSTYWCERHRGPGTTSLWQPSPSFWWWKERSSLSENGWPRCMEVPWQCCGVPTAWFATVF